MTQEPDQTREEPEFKVERAEGARGTGFRVTNDPEDRLFPYEKGDASSRESARAQAQKRASELELQAAAQQTEPGHAEEPEQTTPAPQQAAGPREEPVMAQQQSGPERPRRRRRRHERKWWQPNSTAVLVVLLLGIFGLLMASLINNGLTSFAQSRANDRGEEQALTGTVDINVNVTGLPENYPQEGVEEPTGEDVDLGDPSRYVLPGGVGSVAEAKQHAENQGYSGIASCNFISKAEISQKLASGEMPDMAYIQYRNADDELSYVYGKLEPEDYYFCSTFSGEVLWMMAKCGNFVKPPSKPPVPPGKTVVRFPVTGIWASCPAGTALPDGATRRWFPGTTIVVYEAEARAQLRQGESLSLGWSRAFYQKVQPFLRARNNRVQDFLAKCKQTPTPTPPPPCYDCGNPPPPPTPQTYYGTGSATWSVTTGSLCEPNGHQAGSSGTVTVNQSHLYGRTLAAVTSNISQADANAKAKAIAEAEAQEIEDEKEEYWDNHEDATCDPQSQPSWADDRLRADDDEDDYDGHGSFDEDNFTVEGSDDPDRDPPSEDDVEDDYDDPVQGENPEPRDDDGEDGYDEPPPPPPSHTNKPTNPNGALW